MESDDMFDEEDWGNLLELLDEDPGRGRDLVNPGDLQDDPTIFGDLGGGSAMEFASSGGLGEKVLGLGEKSLSIDDGMLQQSRERCIGLGGRFGLGLGRGLRLGSGGNSLGSNLGRYNTLTQPSEKELIHAYQEQYEQYLTNFRERVGKNNGRMEENAPLAGITPATDNDSNSKDSSNKVPSLGTFDSIDADCRMPLDLQRQLAGLCQKQCQKRKEVILFFQHQIVEMLKRHSVERHDLIARQHRRHFPQQSLLKGGINNSILHRTVSSDAVSIVVCHCGFTSNSQEKFVAHVTGCNLFKEAYNQSMQQIAMDEKIDDSIPNLSNFAIFYYRSQQLTKQQVFQGKTMTAATSTPATIDLTTMRAAAVIISETTDETSSGNKRKKLGTPGRAPPAS